MVGASPPAGSGVGDQTIPVSSSRKYTASPGESLTGSFDHGVSRLAWLLAAQVKPRPASVARQPACGLAITLVHGAGGTPTITYSRPSGVNPPVPLAKRSSPAWVLPGPVGTGGRVGTNFGGCGRLRASASVWSANDPRSPYRTTRAAAST